MHDHDPIRESIAVGAVGGCRAGVRDGREAGTVEDQSRWVVVALGGSGGG
jgi:hypothetical protein